MKINAKKEDYDINTQEGFAVRNKSFWRSLYEEEYSDEEITKGLRNGLEMVESSGALPAWDKTDHLCFLCQSCYHHMKVVKSTFYMTGGYLTLKFGMYCEKCENTGSRKIYLNEEPTSFGRLSYDQKVRGLVLPKPGGEYKLQTKEEEEA